MIRCLNAINQVNVLYDRHQLVLQGNDDVNLPAVGQVECDATTYVLTKAHISNSTEADVEEGDDAHSQIQNQGETLRPLHLVLQRKNLPTHRDKNTTRLLTRQKKIIP